MERINVSSSELDEITPLLESHKNVGEYILCGKHYILKFLESSKAYRDNSIYVLEKLDSCRSLFPKEFCLPEYWIESSGKLEAFLMPKITDSLTLRTVLKSSYFSHKEKIKYLKELGALLRKCDNLRQKKGMRNFAIGDLQETNVLVAPGKETIKVIDMDTCRIGQSASSQALYLTPFSLVMYVPSKYKIVRSLGYFETNRETDLFCYIMIILNYLFDSTMTNMSLENFYYNLNQLDYSDVNHELLSIFYGIINRGQNDNPDYLLDTIDDKTFSKIRSYVLKENL